jgi:hypothetical protein
VEYLNYQVVSTVFRSEVIVLFSITLKFRGIEGICGPSGTFDKKIFQLDSDRDQQGVRK